jgi:predicted alpha/beta hydrolase
MEEQEGDFEEYAASFQNFMQEVEGHARNIVSQSAGAPQTALDHWKGLFVFSYLVIGNFVEAFRSAIDWTESWIQYMLLFYVVLFLFVCLTRKMVNIQTGVFMIVSAMVFLSEHLNTLCSKNWSRFSKQNYFDTHGVFVGIMYATPLLFIAFIQLVLITPRDLTNLTLSNR